MAETPKTLTVELGERSYPIVIGEGLLANAAEYLRLAGVPDKSPLLIVTDDNAGPLYLAKLTEALTAGGYRALSAVVPHGEPSKSLDVYNDLITRAIEEGLDRSSAILALGGGVIGDLAGFVAGTYMRGIRFVQVPTTILAHDSSVGGKVAVNHPLAKNMIGVFHQPELVLYDVETLKSLPPREVRAGLAEMVKHGLIWDKAFAEWCRANAGRLLALDSEALAYGLEQGCAIKARIVSRDERENDLRAILNLGHTLGHAIEAVAGYGRFLHGEAISIGMAAAALIGEERGAAGLHAETVSMLEALELPVTLPADIGTEALMDAMQRDKKFREGRMIFIVPLAVGRVEIASDVDADTVRSVIERLKRSGEPS
ncbi:3-dehydroquinate synthase [Saccharibacillus brassicae]|uniref:3-dehydroquinate synthase n=1 Tax=Saccharibacillus brassicae TaxID=2583377 RepID=A0A4Y6UU14_SACBS|nr:3-dehydroquinate synthase [Saccharibacillus brassicae]QDH19505.1 3-dehydroquinate synthase [Saccharibacillus brassicae]